MGDDELDRIKLALIAEWDGGRSKSDVMYRGAQAVLEALPPQSPPLGGLSIGHSRDPRSGELRLDILTTARKGPNLARARRIKKTAQLQGLRAMLRYFTTPPVIQKRPQFVEQGPALGGVRRPLHIGSSVAHEQGLAGTLGAFVEIDGGKTGILSCTHVLARPQRGRARHGDFIQQPGLPDAVTAGNRIGELTRQFAPFIASRGDNLDAAIAMLEDGLAHEGNVVPDVDCVPERLRGRTIGRPLARRDVPLGAPVIKVGRQTGFTRGILSRRGVENFRPSLGSEGSYTFGTVDGVSWIEGEPGFTDRGDSGSLILLEEGLHPLGLHFCAVRDEPFPDEDEGTLEHPVWMSYFVPWWRIDDIFHVRLKG